jgi:uncharacterized damage-inducible protein DinB
MNIFFQALYDRFHELHGDIARALESLPEEALDWKPAADMNSVNVIITHLSGAERFLIGDVVMGESSNRSREAEFQASGLTKQDLLQRLSATDAYIQGAFEKMSLSDLENERIHPRHGNKVNVAFAILHALEHAATHVGHTDLTVQLWRQRMTG